MDLFTDCRSIFDALQGQDLRIPTEEGLYPLLLIIKHLMTTGLIDRLYWIDTRDMLADGLNKGVISREAILTYCRTGTWILKHEALQHTERVHVPLPLNLTTPD